MKALLIIFVALLISACANESPKKNLDLNSKFNFSSEEYKTAIRNVLKDYSKLNNHLDIQFGDTLSRHYEKLNYEPLFIRSFEDKYIVDSILFHLNRSDEHGLNADEYHTSKIKTAIEFALGGNTNSQERYEKLAEAEILIADGIIKYSNHLRYGVLNPKEILIDSYFFPVPDSSSKNILEPLLQKEILEYIEEIQPKNKRYKLLQGVLKNFKLMQNKKWEPILLHSKKIKIGDTDSSVLQIVNRLADLKFLDASFGNRQNSIIYDSSLSLTVKRFQKAYGLTSDGIINQKTIDKLNITPKEYIQKINVNLERIRWFDYSDTSKYILVNIPDFRLYIVDGNTEVMDITVCTGRKRSEYVHNQLKQIRATKRKPPKVEDWETPVLYSQLTHLVLNPTWTVPFSIMREEIANKVRRDSTYLKRANFRVYRNGSQINPTEVKVSELSGGSIPYTIIQNPGAGNALGKIKFMFENPFGVYLHDTPTRAPFKYENRAVSHGCVRVEKPMLLAEFLLKHNSKWNIDYLKIEIGQKVDDKSIVEDFKSKRNELRKNFSYGNTTEVRLENSLPLFIDYFTAWVDRDGIFNIRDDVYRQDKMVMEYLFN